MKQEVYTKEYMKLRLEYLKAQVALAKDTEENRKTWRAFLKLDCAVCGRNLSGLMDDYVDRGNYCVRCSGDAGKRASRKLRPLAAPKPSL